MEDVLSIYHREKPVGVITQFGGQTPLNLAQELKANGVNILGTSPEAIDLAEDRDQFRAMMEKLGIPMPQAEICLLYTSPVSQCREGTGKTAVYTHGNP